MINWRRVTLRVVAVAVLVACEAPTATAPVDDMPRATIVDDARGGVSGFLWRVPTVTTNAASSATFDAGALNQLAVEICQLDSAQIGCTGSLVARYTSSGSTRIQLDAGKQEYYVSWKTDKKLSTSAFFRARVVRNGTALGFIDVDVVSNNKELSSVNRTLYVGVARGSAVEFRFRVMLPSVQEPPPPPPWPTPVLAAWPGSSTVQNAGLVNALGTNMSGLAYETSGTTTPGVLWASKNGPGTLYRLVWNGSAYVSDASNGWGAGKTLRYPGGSGNPDAEGVTFASGSAAGMYVVTERNNDASSTSRNSILRFDVSGTSATLVATREWNLTSDLPVVGSNTGLEAITWVPDAFLVARGFHDESKSAVYNPALYPDHGDGLFFVGMEQGGRVYAYALNHASGAFTRVASFASGFAGVMGLEFDREQDQLWVTCDDGCSGRSAVFAIDSRAGAATQGRFVAIGLFSRPTGMSNLNNEGFAIGSRAECVGGTKPVFWADDGGTSGQALRRGTVTCNAFGMP